MIHFENVNFIAALVAALSGFVIGGLWYGPLFQKPWMRLTGMTKEKGAEASMAVTFGLAYVLNFIAAIGIGMLMGPHDGLHLGAHAGLAASVFFVVTAIGVIYLFEQRPLKLFFINAGYQIVNFTAMGLILGAWP
jgi:Protein of unknown function (DUF1761)